MRCSLLAFANSCKMHKFLVLYGLQRLGCLSLVQQTTGLLAGRPDDLETNYSGKKTVCVQCLTAGETSQLVSFSKAP